MTRRRPSTPATPCTSTRAPWSNSRHTRLEPHRQPEEVDMKYFHLVWAALFRRKTRTFLTLASIMAAFLLFGLLDGIRTSFAQIGQNADGAQRLQTTSRLSMVQMLPLALRSRIEQV